jgi:hypothetical protein
MRLVQHNILECVKGFVMVLLCHSRDFGAFYLCYSGSCPALPCSFGTGLRGRLWRHSWLKRAQSRFRHLQQHKGKQLSAYQRRQSRL